MWIPLIALVLLAGCQAAPSQREEGPRPAPGPSDLRLIQAKKIWDAAPHNAFTDLIRFEGLWYCVFREGSGHVSPDGALRVLSSPDGERWSSSALVTLADADLRDAKISETPDGRLMLCGAAAWHDRSEHTHQTFAWFSRDGIDWSAPVAIADPDYWLWRVSWHENRAYGFGYGCRPEQRGLRFYASDDGETFETLVDSCAVAGYPNETSMVFRGDTVTCLLRRDDAPAEAMLGRAVPPYTSWSWQPLDRRVGGPVMMQLPDGRMLATVRLYDEPRRTSLCWLDLPSAQLTEALALPSGGDTSYAGMVWHEGKLWISYYASHEGKSAIYLAQVAIDS